MCRINEFQKNLLLKIISEYKKTKENSLLPIFDELEQSLGHGRIKDAYQARYLRDALSTVEDLHEDLSKLNKEIEEKYFS